MGGVELVLEIHLYEYKETLNRTFKFKVLKPTISIFYRLHTTQSRAQVLKKPAEKGEENEQQSGVFALLY